MCSLFCPSHNTLAIERLRKGIKVINVWIYILLIMVCNNVAQSVKNTMNRMKIENNEIFIYTYKCMYTLWIRKNWQYKNLALSQICAKYIHNAYTHIEYYQSRVFWYSNWIYDFCIEMKWDFWKQLLLCLKSFFRDFIAKPETFFDNWFRNITNSTEHVDKGKT